MRVLDKLKDIPEEEYITCQRIKLRSSNGTQQEHANIAIAIKDIFKTEFKIIAEALEW